MPTINDIKISDAEFTAMQELATAWILKRAFQDNVKFNSEEDIVRDAPTLKGLQNIFKYNQKQLFIFKTPIVQKTPEAKWLNTFYLQQKKLLEDLEVMNQKDRGKHSPRSKTWIDKVKDFFE